MGCMRLSIILCLVLSMSTALMAKDNRVKKSGLGLLWPSSKDEGKLSRKLDAETQAKVGENDEFDGGFSSLGWMLQWAIGHSDAAELKETAQTVQRLSPMELKQRQMEIKELMEKLKMPSDAQLMQLAIDDLNNSSISLENRLRALEELLVLVEPVDNANDLDKLGGLAAVVRQLDDGEPDVRKLAAWVLGKAIQNNPVVQQQVLDRGTLPKLMKMARSDFIEEAIKALYAISAVVRNNLFAQELFYAVGGHLILKDILSNSTFDIRLRRKCLILVGDVAQSQLDHADKAELPFLHDPYFLKAVVDLTSAKDLDLQEKALIAIRNLLLLRTNQALVFKEYCKLDMALERMSLQLQQFSEEENKKDYAKEMEILRQEVELVFLKKLEKDGKTQNEGDTQSAYRKAGDVVTAILAKGFIFGKDAINKAKSFNEKHELTSTAFTKISSFDQKISLSKKISMGTSAVNSKVKEMDERFQVSEKIKTSYVVAEEKVSDARSTILSNKYVKTGATWFGDAYDRVAKVAGEVGQRTREKVRMAEEERERE